MAILDFIINNSDQFLSSYSIPEFTDTKNHSILPHIPSIWGALPKYDGLINSLKEHHIELGSNADLYEPICKYCKEKSIDETMLYKKGNFDKSVLTRIRGMRNTNYIPQKNILIRICLVLELNHMQTQELLFLVGYSLSNDIIADKIISFAIEQKIYDIIEIDYAIYKITGKYYLSSK